ncbi:MAG: hypothetical protein QXP03_00720 [Desulfurococcaceae archaeon]
MNSTRAGLSVDLASAESEDLVTYVKLPVLLKFFYNLVGVIDGLLVAIAEIPWGKGTLNLSSVEFVADARITYKSGRIARGIAGEGTEAEENAGNAARYR